MARSKGFLIAVLATAAFGGTFPGSASASTQPAPSSDASAVHRAAKVMDAIELRVLLGRLLGEHSFLLMDAMRASTVGQEDRDALIAALADNSAELTGAIEAVYGAEAGRRFGALWEEHVQLLLDYADATRAGDDAGRRAAADGLDDYTVALGQALVSLNPSLLAHDETEALKLHIDQVRAFADGDYAGAYAAHRAAFQHMFKLGDHLALEIARQFPDRFPGGAVAFSPRSDLRLSLDQLLGEHLVLAALAMRAGVTQSADFTAAGDALNGNTDDLSAAIGGIYGQGAADLFKQVWSEHINAYVTFVQALGSGDDEARASSLAALHAYHDRIAEFLSGVNPQLDRQAVGDLIRRHVQALVTQAEATAAEDPARAIAATRDGYDGTFEVGAALAEAIAAQHPERFRDLRDLPATDTAASHASGDDSPSGSMLRAALVMAIASMAVIAGTETRRRRSVRAPKE